MHSDWAFRIPGPTTPLQRMTAATSDSRLQLFTLGLNHETAPLAMRERVAFAAERLQEIIRDRGEGLEAAHYFRVHRGQAGQFFLHRRQIKRLKL